MATVGKRQVRMHDDGLHVLYSIVAASTLTNQGPCLRLREHVSGTMFQSKDAADAADISICPYGRVSHRSYRTHWPHPGHVWEHVQYGRVREIAG